MLTRADVKAPKSVTYNISQHTDISKVVYILCVRVTSIIDIGEGQVLKNRKAFHSLKIGIKNHSSFKIDWNWKMEMLPSYNTQDV